MDEFSTQLQFALLEKDQFRALEKRHLFCDSVTNYALSKERNRPSLQNINKFKKSCSEDRFKQ